MPKNRTDAQTANEEQAKVSGVLEGGNTYTDAGVDHGAPDGFSEGGESGGIYDE